MRNPAAYDLTLRGLFLLSLYLLCGKVFARLPSLPPVRLPMLLLRGVVGALAVADLLLRRRGVKA